MSYPYLMGIYMGEKYYPHKNQQDPSSGLGIEFF